MTKTHSFEDLVSVLAYCSSSGEFRWKIKPNSNMFAGDVAGHTDYQGYRAIRYGRILYRAHRLAWLLHHGSWPKDQIDHINGKKDDNRIENLREADPSENKWNQMAQSNNSHGSKGVAWDAQKQRWVARIMIRGKRMKIGRYRTREEATRAYAVAAEKYAGEFAMW